MAEDGHVPWWRDAVVYQVYPRSFLDTNGDGIGDLPGIERRLDHLSLARHRRRVDLAVLPVADGGLRLRRQRLLRRRSVVRHAGGRRPPDRRRARARHPRAGRLGAEPHVGPAPLVPSSRARRGHRRSATGITGGTAAAARRRTTGARVFGGPAWTLDDATGQWYLHLFLPQQPDLNWSNPEVVDAMHEVLRFWLDRGVDGFRIDVVHCIGKDPTFPDQPAELGEIDRVGIQNEPTTHELIRGFRRLVDGYPGERTTVGEVNLGDLPRSRASTATATSCTWCSTSCRCTRRGRRRPGRT